MGSRADRPLDDGDAIFVRYFRHWKTKKIVYPKKGTVIRIPLRKKRK